MITKHVGPTIALNKCKVCVHISRCLYLSVTVYPFLVSDIHVCVYIYISRKSPVSTKCLFTAPRPRDRIKAAVAYCGDKLRAKTHIRLGQCIIKIWQQVTTIYNSCYAYFVFCGGGTNTRTTSGSIGSTLPQRVRLKMRMRSLFWIAPAGKGKQLPSTWGSRPSARHVTAQVQNLMTLRIRSCRMRKMGPVLRQGSPVQVKWIRNMPLRQEPSIFFLGWWFMGIPLHMGNHFAWPHVRRLRMSALSWRMS